MNKKKDLAINKNFTLALQNHKKNNFQMMVLIQLQILHQRLMQLLKILELEDFTQ